MIVLPIVISSLTVGVANLGDIKKLGTIGLKTIIYFEVLSTIAFILGIIVANITHIGYMIDLSHLKNVDISQYVHAAKVHKDQGPTIDCANKYICSPIQRHHVTSNFLLCSFWFGNSIDWHTRKNCNRFS